MNVCAAGESLKNELSGAGEGINAPILLVCESVFGVASMGAYSAYAPIDAP
jgi:hypothetical protein